ncbi:hypothetical protein NMG60_11002405 [Bertholletia excelsa]
MGRDDQYSNRRQKESPSFSSTLLDAIYRSIDEGEGEEELVLYRGTMRKKQSKREEDEDTANLRRAWAVEKWMEKKVTEKVIVRPKSLGGSPVLLNSSSSSSDSSSGGGFSTSDTESVYGGASSAPSCFAGHWPRPIRTSVSDRPPEKLNKQGSAHHMLDVFPQQKTKPCRENGFSKTKSKAMKIYGDLKKSNKQPTSPAGRVASFLNSLFTAKKAKVSSAERGYDEVSKSKSKSAHTSSTCSSASSFSRSCLSKTPSSRGKPGAGAKRSVRFDPVNVILDEDCKRTSHRDEPCLEKLNVTQKNSINEEKMFRVMERKRVVEEAARDILKNYQRKVENEFKFQFEDDDEDEDGASCASSDLFELDNLSAIGIERYCEELPVYETTHLDTNRAIASGLIS